MRAVWLGGEERTPDAFARSLKHATKVANERINHYAVHHPEFKGMGTTATIAGLLGDTLYVAQVGDSRAYLVREGHAIQLTKDQSLMQKLVEAGELTEEEAEHSDRRNIILQALGPEGTIKVDLTHQDVRRGDTLVLCSDGLSTQVNRDEIARVVTEEPDLTEACRRLIDLANEKGGPDNITVIIARFDGEGLASPRSGEAIGHRVFPLDDSGNTPAMAFERVTGEITQPIPAMIRPTPPQRTTRPMPELAGAETPTVSARRRSAGRFVALSLFVVLVLGALWFAWSLLTAAGDTPPVG
jgi:PPM family protein phosphatase